MNSVVYYKNERIGESAIIHLEDSTLILYNFSPSLFLLEKLNPLGLNRRFYSEFRIMGSQSLLMIKQGTEEIILDCLDWSRVEIFKPKGISNEFNHFL